MNVFTKDGPKSVPNPNAPDIDPATKRLKGAVVYLRGIDPAKATMWGSWFVPVFEANDIGITDPNYGHVGFVRHGGEFVLSSKGTLPHVIRGRGASNFAVPLPDPGVPTRLTAHHPGRIELTSGSNIAPAVAHLFVCEHPYYLMTGGTDDFRFGDVPAGEYELVAWHPNWHIVGHDRNPETGLINRYRYGEPFEKVSRVVVKAGGLTTVSLNFP